jgi:DNA-binding GntR family transcriptional regulator
MSALPSPPVTSLTSTPAALPINPTISPTTSPTATLQQDVLQQLRQRIVEGVLAPGGKLNERELSEWLQVSRTPLREALRMLAAEGLVELLPNRGAVVAQLSTQDVADSFEVIAGLEAQAGELAAARIDPAALAEIRASHHEMLAAFIRRDLPTYYRLNATIHAHINTAAGNRVLTQTWATLNARLQALRFRSNFDEAKWQRAVGEHERMVELLARRDGPALGALMRQHLLNKRDAVIELMRGGDVASATWASTALPIAMAGPHTSTVSAVAAPGGAG